MWTAARPPSSTQTFGPPRRPAVTSRAKRPSQRFVQWRRISQLLRSSIPSSKYCDTL